jgi:hypothetical protein
VQEEEEEEEEEAGSRGQKLREVQGTEKVLF